MIHTLLTFLILSASSFDKMSPQEKKNTGIDKLSEKEKGELQEWVKNNYKPAAASTLPKEKRPTLVQNVNNGSYLKLSDDSMWNVRPQDTPISQGWISEVEIIITPSSDPLYPNKLTNSVSNSSILAKRVKTIPSSTPAPTTQPPNPVSPSPPKK